MSDIPRPNLDIAPDLEPANASEGRDDNTEPLTTLFLIGIGVLLLLCLALLLIGERRPPPGL